MTGSSALFLYCVAIAAASLGGGIAARRLRVSHLGMQLAMSFVGGLILGVAVLHMLPHAVAASPGSLNWIAISVLFGIIGMLLLMRVFNVHQHQSDEELAHDYPVPAEGGSEPNVAGEHARESHEHASEQTASHSCDHDHDSVGAGEGASGKPLVSLVPEPELTAPTPSIQRGGHQLAGHLHAGHDHAGHGHAEHGHGHGCQHTHHHHGPSPASNATLRWLGLAIGMTVHSLLDGIALAAFVASDQHLHQPTWWHMPGFGIFLAVLFHKPLDASSIVWLMRSSGWTGREMITINLLFAAMTPLGVMLFQWGLLGSSLAGDQMLGIALGFSAGVFLCISLSDILPEVQFHSHDRTKLTAALILGVALAWLVGLFEPSTAHLITAPIAP